MSDSTAAIMAAVEALNAVGGGRIYYPRGTYLVGTSSQVSYVHSNIWHEGESTESVAIVNASANQPAFAIGNGVTQLFGGGVRSMRFTGGPGVVGVTGQTALTIQKLGQFRIEDVFISNAVSALYRGAQFVNCSQHAVYNLEVQGCTLDGITNIQGVDSYFVDSRSDANGGSGWLLNNAQGGYYKGCTAYNNTAVAWDLSSSTPATNPNFNNFFVECIGDTSGNYNWQVSDSWDSYWLGCWGSTQQSAAVNTSATGFIFTTANCRNLFLTGCVANFNNSHGFQVFDPGASAPLNIHFVNCQGGTQGPTGSNGNGRAGAGFGLSVNGNCTQIRVIGGAYLQNASGSISNTTSGTQDIIVQGAVGFVSTNQGTGNVGVGNSSVTVTHGLGFTPNLSNLHVTPTSSMAASGINSFWTSNPTSTQFTVNTNAAVAGAAFNFAWRASYNGT